MVLLLFLLVLFLLLLLLLMFYSGLFSGCDPDRFGSDECRKICSAKCKDTTCDVFDGSCKYGCTDSHALSIDCIGKKFSRSNKSAVKASISKQCLNCFYTTKRHIYKSNHLFTMLDFAGEKISLFTKIFHREECFIGG